MNEDDEENLRALVERLVEKACGRKLDPDFFKEQSVLLGNEENGDT